VKLGKRARKYVSLGGRVTILNSILSNLPLYYLSFFRAPKKVLSIITSIHGKFLWGGTENKNKVNWVKWCDVCKPKLQGGLGVKDLSIFNLALLAKWQWRFLNDHNSL